MKDSNNKILMARNEATGAPEMLYVISDLGGSMGKTGGIFSRSRNKPADFVKANFIEGVKHNVIDFHYSGKNKAIFDGITLDDATGLAPGWESSATSSLRTRFAPPTTARKTSMRWPRPYASASTCWSSYLNRYPEKDFWPRMNADKADLRN